MRLRHDGRVVAAVRKPFPRARLGIVGEQQIVDVAELPGDGLGIRVEQQLGVVETQPPLRPVFAANLVAVELAGPQPFDPARAR